jgi:hypothetical protein
VKQEDAAGPAAERCARQGIRPGMPSGDVERTLGPPDSVCRRYSRNAGPGYYRSRIVCFAGGKVEFMLRNWARRQ